MSELAYNDLWDVPPQGAVPPVWFRGIDNPLWRRRNCTFVCRKFLVLTMKNSLKLVTFREVIAKLKLSYRFFGQLCEC